MVLLHYFDDFLTISRPGSTECYRNLQIMVQVCQLLNILLAIEKIVRMEACLLEDKFVRLRSVLAEWLDKRKATKWQILSLVGILRHAAKVVCPGRIFVCHIMYSVTAQVTELDHFTRLNNGFRSDSLWWHLFADWNGCSYPQFTIQTDASGTWDYKVFSNVLLFDKTAFCIITE